MCKIGADVQNLQSLERAVGAEATMTGTLLLR
jgi:hypothetical protein